MSVLRDACGSACPAELLRAYCRFQCRPPVSGFCRVRLRVRSSGEGALQVELAYVQLPAGMHVDIESMRIRTEQRVKELDLPASAAQVVFDTLYDLEDGLIEEDEASVTIEEFFSRFSA